MKRVNKTDLISDVVEKYPKASEIMMDYGLHCAGCFLNQFETVEEGAKLHGMTDPEIETMLKDINTKLKKGQNGKE